MSDTKKDVYTPEVKDLFEKDVDNWTEEDIQEMRKYYRDLLAKFNAAEETKANKKKSKDKEEAPKSNTFDDV